MGRAADRRVPIDQGVGNMTSMRQPPNCALLTDAFSLARRACGAAKRER